MYKSGFVTIVGRPNVGKSTLTNQIMGEKLSIVSNKPQTTRNNIQTILTGDDYQLVFVDTPGIHKPKNKLGDYMVNAATSSIKEVDLVVLATGVRPNTSFLKDTGIEMLDNGAIVIDNQGRTSIEDIYAAGDCATVYHLVKQQQVYIPLATNANKLGRIVGSNLGGKSETFQGTLGSSCIKLLDMEAAATGITEADAKKMNLNYKATFITDKNHTDYCPGQEKISIKLIYDADTKVILGGQAVGKSDAVQRTNVLATAIFAKMTTEQLGMLDLCYAPPFARTWDALNIAGNVSK